MDILYLLIPLSVILVLMVLQVCGRSITASSRAWSKGERIIRTIDMHQRQITYLNKTIPVIKRCLMDSPKQ